MINFDAMRDEWEENRKQIARPNDRVCFVGVVEGACDMTLLQRPVPYSTCCTSSVPGTQVSDFQCFVSTNSQAGGGAKLAPCRLSAVARRPEQQGICCFSRLTAVFSGFPV